MLSDYRGVLKNKQFLYLWFSQILSQITINLLNFLLLVYLFSVTESTLATSFLWVAYAMPAIVFGPLVSVIVDMADRRKILQFSNFFQSMVVFIYAFIYQRNPYLPYAIAVAYSFLNQFYVPAEAASLPALVKKTSLPHANGLFFLTQQAAVIIGFGLAGVFAHLFGFKTSLLICTVLLLLAYISVTLLPKMTVGGLIPEKLENDFIDFFKQILDGYQYIKNNNRVLFPFLILLVFQIFLAVVMINVPTLSREIFNIPLNYAGYYLVVPAGFGAVLASVLVPNLLKRGIRKVVIIKNALLLITVSDFVVALVINLLKKPLSLLVGSISIAVIGFSFVGVVVPCLTFLQENTEGGIRGRVFGNFWFLATIVTVFPVVFSGVISDILGVRVLVMAIGLLTMSGYWLLWKYRRWIFMKF